MTEKICPACGGELIIVPPSTHSDTTSWVMLIAGIFLTPILIGIILIIWALSRGFTIHTDAYYDCLKCNWNNLSYTWDVTTSEDGSRVFNPIPTEKNYGPLILVLVLTGIVIIACLVCFLAGTFSPT